MGLLTTDKTLKRLEDVLADECFSVKSTCDKDERGVNVYITLRLDDLKDWFEKTVFGKRGCWEDIMRNRAHLEGKPYQGVQKVLKWTWELVWLKKGSALIEITPRKKDVGDITEEDVDNIEEILINTLKYDLYQSLKVENEE